MSKRCRDDDDEVAAATHLAEKPFSTMSVYTYNGPLCTHFVTAAQAATALPALLSAVFGSRKRHSVFSFTAGATGSFLVLDETLHRELFGGSGSERWSCLYIHESSSARSGADVSGSLSLLFEHLTHAQVSIINVCTMRRNFVLVRQTMADVALQTLRSALDGDGRQSPPPASDAASFRGQLTMSSVRIELLRSSLAIGTLTLAQLKESAHSILHLLFLRRSDQFVHYFEMGGEISLAISEGPLEALELSEPESTATLRAALEPSLSRGWRIFDVTAATGYDGIGILSAVCLPLATLPLMNFSTLDHTYVLVPEVHLEAALELLALNFDVTTEPAP